MKTQPIEIYVHGGGANPHGRAVYAWICCGSAVHVQRGNAWTQHEAVYRAIIGALSCLPAKSVATVLSHSGLIVDQINGNFDTKEPRLLILLNRVREIMERRQLSIEVRPIHKSSNLAASLLNRKIPGMDRPSSGDTGW